MYWVGYDHSDAAVWLLQEVLDCVRSNAANTLKASFYWFLPRESFRLRGIRRGLLLTTRGLLFHHDSSHSLEQIWSATGNQIQIDPAEHDPYKHNVRYQVVGIGWHR